MLAMLIQAAGSPQDLPQATPVKIPVAQAITQIKAGSIFSDKNLAVTYLVLTFGLLALVILFLLARREPDGDPRKCDLRQFEMRIFVITILIFGSLLVAAADFGSDNLTPLIGFFGTIAGYILGRGDRPAPETKKPETPNEGR